MKNVQVRLADGVYETLKDVARLRGLTLADVVRDAFEVYAICVAYAQEGKRLMWEDAGTGDKVEVRIAGVFPGEKKQSRVSARGVRQPA